MHSRSVGLPRLGKVMADGKRDRAMTARAGIVSTRCRVSDFLDSGHDQCSAESTRDIRNVCSIFDGTCGRTITDDARLCELVSRRRFEKDASIAFWNSKKRLSEKVQMIREMVTSLPTNSQIGRGFGAWIAPEMLRALSIWGMPRMINENNRALQ